MDVFSGSTATAKNGYRFDGWYLDKNCTESVGDKATVTGNTIVPNTAKLDPIPNINDFYAKFTPVLGDLTITRKNTTGDESNGNRIFVYKIAAEDEPNFNLFVSVKGNEAAAKGLSTEGGNA